MKISDAIQQLEGLRREMGDVEIVPSTGYAPVFSPEKRWVNDESNQPYVLMQIADSEGDYQEMTEGLKLDADLTESPSLVQAGYSRVVRWCSECKDREGDVESHGVDVLTVGESECENIDHEEEN